jgi:hypothetical protein
MHAVQLPQLQQFIYNLRPVQLQLLAHIMTEIQLCQVRKLAQSVKLFNLAYLVAAQFQESQTFQMLEFFQFFDLISCEVLSAQLLEFFETCQQEDFIGFQIQTRQI